MDDRSIQSYDTEPSHHETEPANDGSPATSIDVSTDALGVVTVTSAKRVSVRDRSESDPKSAGILAHVMVSAVREHGRDTVRPSARRRGLAMLTPPVIPSAKRRSVTSICANESDTRPLKRYAAMIRSLPSRSDATLPSALSTRSTTARAVTKEGKFSTVALVYF